MSGKPLEYRSNQLINKFYSLLKNNVKEVKDCDNELLFEVISGEASCLIKTSYFDFSNQSKNIKLALENYQYKINII